MTAGRRPAGPVRVLLVEDSDSDVAAIRRALERQEGDFELATASRAEQALPRVTGDGAELEVLVADHRLPGSSGLELCQEVIARGAPVATVLLTGAGSEHLAVAALKAGVDEYLIKDTRNRYLELLPTVLQEVAARLHARLAHERAEATVRYLAAIVESSDDAIIGCDLDLRLVSWNPAAERMFGYRADEAIDQPLGLILPQDHGEEMPRMMERILAGERIEHYETVRRRRDGSLVDVSLTVSPIRGADGAIRGASAIVRDITERRHAEAQRRRAHRAVETLLHGVAHELRSPLMSVSGMLDLVRQEVGPDPSEELATYFDHLGRSTRWMLRLIDGLAEMSRAGRADSRSRPLAPAPVAREVAAEVRGRAGDRDLEIRIAADLPEVLCSPQRLRCVLGQLLDNAVQFCPDPVRVEIGRRAGGRPDRAELYVRDQGPGIPRSEQARVFDLFYRRPGQESSGTGMGLTLARRSLESAGGRIWVESEVGRGATFVFTLPCPRP